MGIIFDLIPIYRYNVGCQQGKPDALSCCSYLAPKEGDATYEK